MSIPVFVLWSRGQEPLLLLPPPLVFSQCSLEEKGFQLKITASLKNLEVLNTVCVCPLCETYLNAMCSYLSLYVMVLLLLQQFANIALVKKRWRVQYFSNIGFPPLSLSHNTKQIAPFRKLCTVTTRRNIDHIKEILGQGSMLLFCMQVNLPLWCCFNTVIMPVVKYFYVQSWLLLVSRWEWY